MRAQSPFSRPLPRLCRHQFAQVGLEQLADVAVELLRLRTGAGDVVRGGAVAIADDVIRIPDCDPLVATIPAAVALQLLSYHVARLRDCPIDQPRNLAKSVTVE